MHYIYLYIYRISYFDLIVGSSSERIYEQKKKLKIYIAKSLKSFAAWDATLLTCVEIYVENLSTIT